jgi:2-hydroxychromene-2-carboxylate isomerase
MPGTLEFWFDLSCPYAYLASTQVEALMQQYVLRPEDAALLLHLIG